MADRVKNVANGLHHERGSFCGKKRASAITLRLQKGSLGVQFGQKGVVAGRPRADYGSSVQEKFHLLRFVIRGPLEHLKIVAQDQ